MISQPTIEVKYFFFLGSFRFPYLSELRIDIGTLYSAGVWALEHCGCYSWITGGETPPLRVLCLPKNGKLDTPIAPLVL